VNCGPKAVSNGPKVVNLGDAGQPWLSVFERARNCQRIVLVFVLRRWLLCQKGLDLEVESQLEVPISKHLDLSCLGEYLGIAVLGVCILVGYLHPTNFSMRWFCDCSHSDCRYCSFWLTVLFLIHLLFKQTIEAVVKWPIPRSQVAIRPCFFAGILFCNLGSLSGMDGCGSMCQFRTAWSRPNLLGTFDAAVNWLLWASLVFLGCLSAVRMNGCGSTYQSETLGLVSILRLLLAFILAVSFPFDIVLETFELNNEQLSKQGVSTITCLPIIISTASQ